MIDNKTKKQLKMAIIISFIPLVNYLALIIFPQFYLAEEAQGRIFVWNWKLHMFRDKKKRWVSFGSVSFLMICAFALVALTDLTGYPLFGIMGYLFPVILTLPLFLYDWHKYVVKGEPWPEE